MRSLRRLSKSIWQIFMPAMLLIFGSTNALWGQSDERLVVVHNIRAVITIPGNWQYVPELNEYNLYSGDDGFLKTVPIPGEFTLDTVCSQQSGEAAAIEMTEIAGQPACVINANENSAQGQLSKKAIVQYPVGFRHFAGEVHFIALEADNAHFDSLLASLSYDWLLVKASAYLEPVLDFIEAYSYFGAAVDWPSIRAGAMQQVENTRNLRAAHGAILEVMQALYAAGDNHSFFLNPAGALLYLDGQFPRVDSIPAARSFHVPRGKRLNIGLGYIALPGAFGDIEILRSYAQAAQDVLREVDQTPTRCWIVDLRLNTGGSYAPMVIGIGTILGEGVFAGFQTATGERVVVSLQDSEILTGEIPSQFDLIENPYSLTYANPPVAVLQSGVTSSSGEVTLIAFLGRPNTRTFGEPTGGFTTGNVSLSLYDGAAVALAASVEIDRNGQIYSGAIEPEDTVVTDWDTFGTDDDPVIKAASDWLQSEHHCSP